MLNPKDKLCFALDVPTANDAQLLINELSPYIGTFKVGLELFISSGPAIVHMVKASGNKCFLDLKLHDIPETVSRSIKQGVDLGADFMTIHASGGRKMMETAAKTAGNNIKLLGVTVLTSMNEAALGEVGYYVSDKLVYRANVNDVVFKLTHLTNDCGITGIVCSSNEIPSLKLNFTNDLFYVTPGIRLAKSTKDDQVRTSTVSAAIKNGSDLLVIGRPIRDAENRVKTAEDILFEVKRYYNGR